VYLDANLSKRLSFREVCGGFDYFVSYVILFTAAVIVGLARYSLKRKPNSSALSLVQPEHFANENGD
jgi:hypothetical protein